MKSINLLLEEDEILLMRMQVRMMEIMLPETNEQIDAYIAKILDATNDVSQNTRNEIGKIQRAMRRVKGTPQYVEFMATYKVVEKMLIKEMEKEETEKQLLSVLPNDGRMVVDSSLIGKNINMPTLTVKHSELERIQSDSPHKSLCPVCEEGYLLMIRHPDTSFLRNIDSCVLCGQMYEYSDIPDNKLPSL
jgi:hypothetical protein